MLGDGITQEGYNPRERRLPPLAVHRGSPGVIGCNRPDYTTQTDVLEMPFRSMGWRYIFHNAYYGIVRNARRRGARRVALGERGRLDTGGFRLLPTLIQGSPFVYKNNPLKVPTQQDGDVGAGWHHCFGELA